MARLTMSTRSCRLLSELGLLLALLLPLPLARAAEQAPHEATAASRIIPQRPLQAVSAERALVFVGGFGDEV